jgi:outer membrane receptor protein involved in Fe transport
LLREAHSFEEEEDFMRRSLLFFLFLHLAGVVALATVFGTVRGIVHDPQHRPVAGIQVVLKAKSSEFSQTAQTDANGEFHFDAVPLAEYTVTVSPQGFATIEQTLSVLSGTAPVLHFELQLASQNQSILVSAAPAQGESVTPTTLVNQLEIQETPGAARTNSLAMITDYVPGSYFTHDQLHVRGGHQVSWLIDGVPIPNTNIASNLGPQVDPKDIDTVEMQRGSYSADYGDRTYGVFNVAPRTGFERNNEAELVLSAGNFYQTDDQLNLGGHTNRFAYYASVNGNRTNLGLQTPTSSVIHDAANGYGGFVSLIYNADSQDQLRFVAQARRDFYQVPFDPTNPLIDPGTMLRDVNRESDSFAAFTWVRTFSPGLVLTVSPFFHYNSADYASDPNDFHSAATQNRSSKYEGGQATMSWIKGRNNARLGFYSFAQQDAQFFHVVYNDGSGTVSPLSQNPDGSLIAVYGEDQFKVTSWLTLNAGLRQTHFSGGVVENATSPRAGASLRIPKLNWVFRGFYGQFYQAPPLGTLSGPALNDIQINQGLDFVPLHGERDEEHQFGVTIPFKGWVLDADNFLTRATNFFDHNSLNNSNIFFPVDVQAARINGWELTLRSPRLRNRAQLYLTYSNQFALGRGCIVGGLIGPCPVPPPGYFALDHDQRNTLHLGGQYTLPWRAYLSTDVYYASGFSNSNPNIPGDHLQPHTTFDLSLGKSFGERFSVNLQGINVANRRVLLDNSFTFGGTHYLNPREIYAQIRYRFHY